jgi:hypothetical protein
MSYHDNCYSHWSNYCYNQWYIHGATIGTVHDLERPYSLATTAGKTISTTIAKSIGTSFGTTVESSIVQPLLQPTGSSSGPWVNPWVHPLVHHLKRQWAQSKGLSFVKTKGTTIATIHT